MVPHPRDRDQFLQLLVRLRSVADKHGDTAFAGALSECLVDASGGAPGCPMANLLLEQYAETGHLPELGGPSKKPLLPLNRTAPPPYDRQRLLEYIHRVLEDRALLKGDLRYVDALHRCQKAMQDHDACPMHRLLRPQQL